MMVANAALGRPARDIVLDPVSPEHFDAIVIHLGGEGHSQFALTLAQ